MKRAWDLFKDRAGFTLIELIIVVIIVGVLAAVALPRYARFVERARAAEAINAIGAVKSALVAGKMETGLFISCTDAASIAANLGVNLNTTNWTYNTQTADALVYGNVYATRVGGPNSGTGIGCSVYNNGLVTWAGSHPNTPKN